MQVNRRSCRLAARYQLALLQGLLIGLKQQVTEDGWLNAIDASAVGPVAEETVMKEAAADEFRDTVNGVFLRLTRVQCAMAAEIKWDKSADLFPEQLSEATSKPIDLTLVDTKRGETEQSKLSGCA